MWWLLACEPAAVDIDDSVDDPTAETVLPTVEEPPPTPSDSAPPLDTAPTDTGTPPPPPVPSMPISGTLAVPAGLDTVPGDVTVGLQIVLNLDGVTTADALRDAWGRVVATSAPAPFGPAGSVDFSMDLPEEPPADGIYVDPAYPDTQMAVLAGVAYVDEDGDGLGGPTDTWVASTFDFIVWVDGELPDDFALDGIALGWNFVVVDPLSGAVVGSPISDGLSGWVLEGNLLPRAGTDALSLVLSGLFGAPGIAYRVDLWHVGDPVTGEPVDDATLSSIAFTPAPFAQATELPTAVPPDHHLYADLGDGELPGALGGVYLPVGYADLDDDGAYAFPPDLPVLVPEGEGLLALYLRFTGPEAVYVAVGFGGSGWALLDPATGDVLPWATVVPLVPPT